MGSSVVFPAGIRGLIKTGLTCGVVVEEFNSQVLGMMSVCRVEGYRNFVMQQR